MEPAFRVGKNAEVIVGEVNSDFFNIETWYGICHYTFKTI
jgi:hypothetical protein